MTLAPPPPFSRRSMLKTASALMLATSLAPLQSLPASALSGPEELVTRIATQVMRLARSGPANTRMQKRFAALLGRYVNMTAVARFALGRYRRKLPASQRARYYRLVKEYIAGLFVYYSKDFRGNGLQIRSTRKSGKYYIIDSRIKLASSTSPVKWRVYASGGKYRVTDVNIRGIWLSIRLREKFTQLLKRNRGDFAALFRFLEKTRTWVPAG